jgi:acyl CoA:acetate/3-ketoacid CoA transferase beta subunit
MDRRAYPDDALKDARVVKRVYMNLAVLDVIEHGFAALDMARGLTFDALQARTEQSCIFPG